MYDTQACGMNLDTFIDDLAKLKHQGILVSSEYHT